MTLTRSAFADFFAAVRPGQRPFAWQERLLDALVTDGRWPDRVVAPTGAGKTAVIDVHVFANALVVTGQAPRLPRRLVLTVDRRAVVDSHDDHARAVARALAQATEGVVAEVATALSSLRLHVTVAAGSDDAAALNEFELEPLVTARLRGGTPPPRGWREAPEACAVLTGTPDMIGSRLLLQGYGSSPRAWPREAGLLAFDTALVVDEAHLSRQFLATGRRLSQLAASSLTGDVPVLQVVETTATPTRGAGSEVGVEPDDLIDPVLDRRMRDPKPVQLLPVDSWPLTVSGLQALAGQVQQDREEFGPTVGCVVNRVASAVALAALLRKAGLTVELLVGRMRPADVALLRERRPGLLSTSGHADVDVLVATQTVEVGLDLDLSALVTELAPGAALAQRSGRVNRRGDRQATRVTVAVPRGEAVSEAAAKPYAVEDLAQARHWLDRRAGDEAGLAPWSLRHDPPPTQALRRTLLRRLERADSWVWAATGDALFERPALALWLADDLSADRDVGLVVRADLPSDPVRAVELVRLVPPRAHEVFPVPIGTLRALLPALTVGSVVRWRRDDVEFVLDAEQSPRIGDVYVVDAATPVQVEGVVAHGQPLQPADDVLELALEPVRPGGVVLRRGTLSSSSAAQRQLPEAVRTLLGEGPAGPGGDWLREQRRQLADLLDTGPAEGMTGAALGLLRGRVKDCAVHVLADDEGRPALLVLLDLRRAVADENVKQTWTPSTSPVPLEQHAHAVAATAADLATSLHLPAGQVAALRLAGLHHDAGKADPRFQRVLGREPTDPLLAKSAVRPASSDDSARSASGLPPGWRHEQLSVLHVWREVPEPARRLVARLVGTTHGHGRSTFPHGARSLLDPATTDPDAVMLFDEGLWEQLVHDTDEEHGVWALAYLEAVLRAADGRVSAAGS